MVVGSTGFVRKAGRSTAQATST